ncbi:MAG: PQQ-binding-like beta-propeller repeat protein [Micromonosporaceae bacterium]|nr:PQQ-binding-like beta-propeller repeat protein [Micromonosporaceae bacterium]
MDLPVATRRTATIELGGDFEPEERVPRGLAFGVRARRLLLVALLGAVGLGGSPPPARQPLTPTAALPDNVYLGFQLSGGTVYTVSSGDAVTFSQLPTLDAYRLGDGRRLWRIPLPLPASLPEAVPIGAGVLLVTGTASAAPGDRTVAVDQATGTWLWSSPLPWLRLVPAGRTVLVGAYLEADGGPGISPLVDTPSPRHPPPLQLAGLDPRTGRVAWSVRVPAGYWTGLPREADRPGDPAGSGGSRYAVMVSPGGSVSTIDLTDGAVSRPVPLALAVQPDLRLIGDWLVVAGGTSLSAYRLADLRLQWTFVVNSPHPATVACGTLICVNDGRDSLAVVAATGRLAWSTTRWTPTGTLGGWIYAVPAAPPGTTGDGAPAGPAAPALLDPGTGAPVLTLTGWALVPGMLSPGGGPYLLRAADPEVAPTAAIGVTWLALLHPGGGRPRIEPLAPVPEVFGNGCAAADVWIVCETRENSLRAWRYLPAGTAAGGDR